MRPLRWAIGVAFTATLACSSSSTSSMADAAAVDAGAAAPTWNNFAEAFFARYCVSCHDATTPDPSTYPNQNFNVYMDAVGLDATIKCGVSPAGQVQEGCPTAASGVFPPPGQFPIGSGPFPTDAERLRIIAWIQAGAPQGN